MSLLPVLVVEDDADLREAVVDTLTLAGHAVVTASEAAQALKIIDRQAVGLVLTDVMMPGMDGHGLLREIKLRQPHLPVILMTAYGVIDKAVDAMRAGAATYLSKPFEPERLLAEVARHLLRAETGEHDEFVTEDPAVRELLAMAARAAATAATILLTGESGTGKEVMARYIHRHSNRQAGPFVAVNCAAIPENLLESTLFGYEKGAFSGATTAHPGKFEQAQQGTLLLDEVTEMPLALQAKLLRVLQEREVERVGGTRTIALDVRVVATSNRDLAQAVAAGLFREDLYWRLNVFPLMMPALRQRRADILALARHFIRRHQAAFDRQAMTLTAAAQWHLTHHDWPGNIRELENVMQRAMILAPGSEIDAPHLHLPVPATGAVAQPTAAVLASAVPEPAAAADLKTREREHIMETLEKVGGSRKLACQILGMSERTLRYKLSQYRKADAPDEDRAGNTE